MRCRGACHVTTSFNVHVCGNSIQTVTSFSSLMQLDGGDIVWIMLGMLRVNGGLEKLLLCNFQTNMVDTVHYCHRWWDTLYFVKIQETYDLPEQWAVA